MLASGAACTGGGRVGGGWVNFGSGAHAHTHTHTHALLSGGVTPSLSVMVCAFLIESNCQYSEEKKVFCSLQIQPSSWHYIPII